MTDLENKEPSNVASFAKKKKPRSRALRGFENELRRRA
jgi:hypothetical protein